VPEALWATDRGAKLTTLFSSAAIDVVPAIDTAARPKKHGWLPLLTVLFIISYALMTLLIVEQGATIESQRALIRELFRDSTELSAMKIKAQSAAAVAAQQRRGQPAAKNPSSQAPLTQNPSTQAQTPSSQAVPQHRSPRQQQQYQMPSRPAADLSDDRRALIKI